jgi:hypothetical protein
MRLHYTHIAERYITTTTESIMVITTLPNTADER